MTKTTDRSTENKTKHKQFCFSHSCLNKSTLIPPNDPFLCKVNIEKKIKAKFLHYCCHEDECNEMSKIPDLDLHKNRTLLPDTPGKHQKNFFLLNGKAYIVIMSCGVKIKIVFTILGFILHYFRKSNSFQSFVSVLSFSRIIF
jgi:hypothetical protein